MPCVLGVDIGGTNIRLGYVLEDGSVLSCEKTELQGLFKDGVAQGLTGKLEAYMEAHKRPQELCGISVGVPSLVSKDKSLIYSTPNIRGMDNLDLGGLLAAHFKLPVFVDRDVNYLLANDILTEGLDPDRDKDIIGIYIGTGIGNALYLNGRFYSGKNGVAGELGHIPLPGFQEPCSCGKTGCAEAVAGGKYLVKLCKETFPGTAINQLFLKHGGHPLLERFLENLSCLIAMEAGLFDPDYIVLAGGVLEMPAFPSERLIEKTRARITCPYPGQDVKFVFPEHTQAGGVRGGGLLALSKLTNSWNGQLKK